MTNLGILETAMQQSAYEAGCKAEDFCRNENVIVESKETPLARKYLELPLACNLISYGTNIVASVQREYKTIVKDYISTYSVEHCFETPNMHVLNDAFEKYGKRVCFMAEYFLPDLKALQELPCQYELRILSREDFRELYLPEWSNALCSDRKQLDVIGVGAYDKGRLMGLAGASADCDTMWQIGVDVLPEYRRQGIASAITAKLATEILKKDIIPFYCCAWSNIKSARNAIRAGFRPAWAEMTVKPREFVEKMNRGQEQGAGASG